MKKFRLFIPIVLVSFCFFWVLCKVTPPDIRSVADAYIPKLEKNLQKNIVSFWLQKTLDHTNGGYHINIGPNNEPLRPEVKMIVSQARQVWLFSRLVRKGYGGKECLDAAELGFTFIKEKMWDTKNGGFYWQVAATGNAALLPEKLLYGQAFGLYAVSEYYLACKKPEVLTFAREIFELLETKAHDSIHGGYREVFTEEWAVPNPDRFYLGLPPNIKSMNTHLHLLEAMSNFYRASQLPLARERLLELIKIQSETVVRKTPGTCTNEHEEDWTPVLEKDNIRISYGHNLENIWLLIDACDAAGIAPDSLLNLHQKLFDYSFTYGFDKKRGGFYDSGSIEDKPAINRNKVWWVQAEALVCSLYLYRLTQDTKYLKVFTKTYDFIEKYQVDWQNGEWYATITSKGNHLGNKADPWKAGYHNGRAMMECLRILKRFR